MATTATPTLNTISFVQQQPSLLVTSELDNAIQDCKKKVARIAKDCRAKNRKFRLAFDINILIITQVDLARPAEI
jgi:hypothetical protein